MTSAAILSMNCTSHLLLLYLRQECMFHICNWISPHFPINHLNCFQASIVQRFLIISILTSESKQDVTVTVTGIFLLSQEHSQRDQIYVFKSLFNCSHTFTKFSMYIWHTVFHHHFVQVKSLYRMKMVKQFVLFSDEETNSGLCSTSSSLMMKLSFIALVPLSFPTNHSNIRHSISIEDFFCSF